MKRRERDVRWVEEREEGEERKKETKWPVEERKAGVWKDRGR